MDPHLESAEELTSAMEVRSRDDALRWFTDWLHRRDQVTQDITNEDLAAALEILAAELRGEAIEVPDRRSSGLMVAASVLADSADGVRRRDDFTTTASTRLH